MGGVFSPLDRELELLPGAYTPQVYGRLTQLGAWLPFAAAAELARQLLGVRVSKASVVRAAEAVGAAYAALQTEAVAALEDEAAEAPAGAQQLVVSADGAMVPLVHGEWGEVRTVAIGVIGEEDAECPKRKPRKPAKPDQPERRATAITYFSRFTSAEEFTRLALVETHQRGVENAGQVAAVLDGAEWLQQFADYHCPQAVRILDFPHAAQRIAEIAHALWGKRTSKPVSRLVSRPVTKRPPGRSSGPPASESRDPNRC